MEEEGRETRQKRRPGKAGLNFTIDSLALVLMVAMIWTGLIIRYVLPPGSGGRGGGHGLFLWGLDRHEWGAVHFWLAVGLLVLLVLHVALHWTWACNFVRRRVARGKALGKLSRGTAIGAGVGFAVFLGLSVVCFLSMSGSSVAVVAEGGEGGRGEGDRHGEHQVDNVHGFMTLTEVSDETGVPVEEIKASLGLPGRVSAHERLGRLRRRFGFQIEDVRSIVASHQRY